MHQFWPAVVLIACVGCRAGSPGAYLFVWAGDGDHAASDFLAVIDADPASSRYGVAVASVPTGVSGTHPHHTEAEMPRNGHLLANGFHTGRTWLFDVSEPRSPRVLTSFGDLAGFSHPHTFVRLANNHVLATFQYAPGDGTTDEHPHETMPTSAERAPGGLVEMDERGQVFRAGSANDVAIQDRRIHPYSVVPMPAVDRAVSTTTAMEDVDPKATAEWVQFWRLSDLKLLKSIALKPGPRGDEHHLTGEPFLLPGGLGVYVHTFNCGLYLLRGIDLPEPSATFVRGFSGKDCGVPILSGHYWLQTVPDIHGLVALDIADPEHPREISTVNVGDDERPHWIAIDPTGRRVVLNSGGYAKGNRLFLIDFDPVTGKLSLDTRFRDPDGSGPGINMTGKSWPHGFTGTAVPHGTVFSR